MMTDNKKISVTQNLTIRVTPVNRPLDYNEDGEKLGYYNAYIAFDSAFANAENKIALAEQEWMRGIISEQVGYGSHRIAITAITRALHDFTKKFGDLCVDDTENIRW